MRTNPDPVVMVTGRRLFFNLFFFSFSSPQNFFFFLKKKEKRKRKTASDDCDLGADGSRTIMLIIIHGPRTKDLVGVGKKAYSTLKDCAWLTKLSKSKQTNRNRGLLSDCKRAKTTGTHPQTHCPEI